MSFAIVSDAWVPSDLHRDVVAEITELIHNWRPRITWLTDWMIQVEPIPDDDESWRMRMALAPLTRKAIFQVKYPWQEPDGFLFSPCDYSLETMVVHELVHPLLEDLMHHARNACLPGELAEQLFRGATTIEIEKIAWHLTRTLLAAYPTSSLAIRRVYS